jgi:sugar phosphate isomerase/epimerase
MAARGKIHSREYVKAKLAFIKEREKAGKIAMKRIREALDRLVPEAEKHGVILALENRSHHEQAPTEEEMEQLLADYPSAAVGYWHDFGHAQRKANLGLLDHEQWLARMSNRLVGCHLHDVIWPERDHYIPFQGRIDFGRLIPLLPEGVPLVWELHPRRKSGDIKQALAAWKERFGD